MLVLAPSKELQDGQDFLPLGIGPVCNLPWTSQVIKYFLTKDGKEYLRKKHKEFYFKTPEKDKFVDTKEKAGEDIMEHKTKTLRDFLYE